MGPRSADTISIAATVARTTPNARMASVLAR